MSDVSSLEYICSKHFYSLVSSQVDFMTLSMGSVEEVISL